MFLAELYIILKICTRLVPCIALSPVGGYSQRREWDSNPRALADKRFSRPPRYDHFDISPKRSLKRAFIFYLNSPDLSSTFFIFLHFFATEQNFCIYSNLSIHFIRFSKDTIYFKLPLMPLFFSVKNRPQSPYLQALLP